MRYSFKAFFIVGTDTEVGKTFQAALLARELARRGVRVGVYKPVASGVTEQEPGDAELLREASGVDWPLEHVCPQQFAAPLAPPIAAELEGRRVDSQLLRDGAQWWTGKCDLLIVEGAGGGLSPISDSETVLDLVQQLGMPVILVAANRLGVVNHCLLTIEALRARQIPLLGIVLNTLPSISTTQDASAATNLELLGRFAGQVPIVPSIIDLVPCL
jgi:dethiobiotin synthetase